jgi:hypothetical protein
VNNVTAFSAELWARFDSVVSGTRVAIQLGDATPNSNLQAQPGANQWQWEIYVGGTKAVTAPGVDLLWHHLVVTYDGTTVRLYKDGVLGTTTPAAGVTAMTGSLLLGQFQSAGFEWPGALDEVAIYPRALTAPEIAAHYALASAPTARARFAAWLLAADEEGDRRTPITTGGRSRRAVIKSLESDARALGERHGACAPSCRAARCPS